MTSTVPLLEIKGLQAGYGEAEVLHGNGLSMLPGEFLCIIGANTAGKSVGSGEAPIEGLASARRSNGSCSFPASRFHEWAFAI